MVTKELEDYIKKTRRDGHKYQDIKQHLLKHGYTEEEIEQAKNGNKHLKKQKKNYKLYLIAGAIIIALLGGILYLNQEETKTTDETTKEGEGITETSTNKKNLGLGEYGCSKDEDCIENNNLLCNKKTTQCVECITDSQCNIGKICEENICNTGCRENIDCDFDEICIENNCENKQTTTNQEPTTNTETCKEEIVDCGTYISDGTGGANSCFIEAAKNCCKAKLHGEVTLNLFGFLYTHKYYYELQGKEEEKCLYYIKNDGVEVGIEENLKQEVLANGTTEEEIAQGLQELKQGVNTDEGKTGICKYPIAELVSMLENANKGTITIDLEKQQSYDCTGELFEVSYG